MKRYYVVFKGRVQGVGFRYTVKTFAEQLSITGWIRNLNNGDVDMEIQAEQHAIDELINKLLKNKGWIRIDDYAMKAITIIHETSFKIIL
ncbi:MAG: acylphosphatase [Erysipelotrichaceae bacterium]|nr:acylphosphatase [Erysipelotrichaceae bacterium]MDD3924497.1 acylphosphatase [Erysipelotrichaceae bacterium]MDD4643004.1 acylphosphatase [Erysipelotrichaceae bacterium]